jgi:hypothetical protein
MSNAASSRSPRFRPKNRPVGPALSESKTHQAIDILTKRSTYVNTIAIRGRSESLCNAATFQSRRDGMRFVPKHTVVRAVLAVAALGCCCAEQFQSIAPPETGTLNLLLANSKGFVIAADSRRTRLSPLTHWDDSQKLFRIGPHSAMVIAGFASWAAQDSPLDLQVAAVLRDEFMDREWTSGKRSVTDLRGTIGLTVGYQLQLFGALFATARPAPPPEALDFQTLAAGIDKRGRLLVAKSTFTPRSELWGPFNLSVPTYDLTFTSTVVDRFVGLSAGVDTLARNVLDCTAESQNSRIQTYCRLRKEGKLDAMPLDALEGLAAAILAETKRVTPFVGGPDQIGVFSKNGSSKWVLPQLSNDRQKLISTILQLGFTYTPDGRLTHQEYSEARGKHMKGEMRMSLVQPFEQPFTQVFIGARFRGVSVSLDGNVFAGDRFEDVEFEYQGGKFFFADTNLLGRCALTSPPNVEVPAFLASCTPKPFTGSKPMMGSPMRAEPHGCVTRNAAGRVVIKTKGWQRGQDCKGSVLTVPNILSSGAEPRKQ